eukprot:gene11978-25085_t
MSASPSRLYVIFTRHGHRAPARNLFSNQTEIDLWTNHLPTYGDLQELQSKYPVVSHPNNTIPRDISALPFGCLTTKGLDHLKSVGEHLVKTFPSLKSPHTIHVTATNYQRTQVSVQALLTGMNLSTTSDNKNIEIK